MTAVVAEDNFECIIQVKRIAQARRPMAGLGAARRRDRGRGADRRLLARPLRHRRLVLPDRARGGGGPAPRRRRGRDARLRPRGRRPGDRPRRRHQPGRPDGQPRRRHRLLAAPEPAPLARRRGPPRHRRARPRPRRAQPPASRPHGLRFPVDVSTASRATIGGMAANNSCGGRSIRYGRMRENVEAHRRAPRRRHPRPLRPRSTAPRSRPTPAARSRR